MSTPTGARGPDAAPPRQGRSPARALKSMLATLLVLALLAALGVFLWTRMPVLGGFTLRESCTATTPDGEVILDPEQMANAATIAAIGFREGFGEQGVAIALATAIQESKIRNLDYGDRDSLGLFQQRPSQGWGTAAQVQDPVYASEKFYEGLAKVPNYRDLELTDAAQAVQRSAYGDLYGEHEFDATVLAGALSGRIPQAVTCAVRPNDVSAQTEGSSGLTPRAAQVRRELREVFGQQSLGGFAPGGVTSGHMAGSAHYDGRAIDIFFRPINAANRRDGWQVASWLVANAERLGIATVIYDEAIWTARRSGAGWRDYGPGSDEAAEDRPTATGGTLTRDDIRAHRDHVHVDVLRG